MVNNSYILDLEVYGRVIHHSLAKTPYKLKTIDQCKFKVTKLFKKYSPFFTWPLLLSKISSIFAAIINIGYKSSKLDKIKIITSEYSFFPSNIF